MKSELQVVKSLVKKYSDDKKLGRAVRRFLTEDYWIQKGNTLRVLEYREWLEQLEKI